MLYRCIQMIRKALAFLIIFFIGFYFTVNHLDPYLAINTFGFKPFIVKTDSMEPKFYPGDIVIVEPVDQEDLQVGDIIAFELSDRFYVVHSIADIQTSQSGKIIFKTKPFSVTDKKLWDYWGIQSNQILGQANHVIPKLGHVVLFLRSKVGLGTMTLSAVIVWLICRISGREERRYEKN